MSDDRQQTTDDRVQRLGQTLLHGLTAPLSAVRLAESYRAEPATHWPECWREPGHHACAVAEIERLRQAVPDERTDRVFRWHWQSELKTNPLAEGRKDDMILEAVCDGLGTWWARLFTRQQVAARLSDGSLVNHWTAQVQFPNTEGV